MSLLEFDMTSVCKRVASTSDVKVVHGSIKPLPSPHGICFLLSFWHNFLSVNRSRHTRSRHSRVNRSSESSKMHFSPHIVGAVLAASSVNGYMARRQYPAGTGAPWGIPTGIPGEQPYWNNSTESVWVTETVTAYKTYCPSATQFTKGTKTYTATQQTWVTVTDCPKKCTISYQPGPQPTVVPVVPVPVKNTTVPAPVQP